MRASVGDLDAALEIAVRAGMRRVVRDAGSPVDVRRRWRGADVDPVTGESAPGHAAGRPRRRAAPARGPRRASSSACSSPSSTLRPRAARARDLSHGVAAYELMNEPDFVVEEWEADLSRRVRAAAAVRGAGRVGRAIQRRWSTRDRRADHARRRPAPQSVGVGGCRARTGPAAGALVSGPPRPVARRRPLRDAGRRACVGTRPLLLGEFPGNGPAAPPGPARRRRRRRSTSTWSSPCAAAMPAPGRGASAAPTTTGPCRTSRCARFARAHPELVNPRCSAVTARPTRLA